MPAKAGTIRARRGIAARLDLLVLTGLCVFGGPAYSQTGTGETLALTAMRCAKALKVIFLKNHLLGDWCGARTRLLERGVRFDFQYVSDTLWGFKSQQNSQFASWNRFRATVDVDFGKPSGQDGLYFHATGLTQGGGNLGLDLGRLKLSQIAG
jgi:carbohydrate-selective porin OprB